MPTPRPNTRLLNPRSTHHTEDCPLRLCDLTAADALHSATDFDFFLSVGKTLRFANGSAMLLDGIQIDASSTATGRALSSDIAEREVIVHSDISHVETSGIGAATSLSFLNPVLAQLCAEEPLCEASCTRTDVSAHNANQRQTLTRAPAPRSDDAESYLSGPLSHGSGPAMLSASSASVRSSTPRRPLARAAARCSIPVWPSVWVTRLPAGAPSTNAAIRARPQSRMSRIASPRFPGMHTPTLMGLLLTCGICAYHGQEPMHYRRPALHATWQHLRLRQNAGTVLASAQLRHGGLPSSLPCPHRMPMRAVNQSRVQPVSGCTQISWDRATSKEVWTRGPVGDEVQIRCRYCAAIQEGHAGARGWKGGSDGDRQRVAISSANTVPGDTDYGATER